MYSQKVNATDDKDFIIPKDPISSAMYEITKHIIPYAKNITYAPYSILCIAIFFDVLAIYYLNHHDINYFAFFIIAGYFFDCLSKHYCEYYCEYLEDAIDLNRIIIGKFITGCCIVFYIFIKRYNILNSPVSFLILLGLICLALIYEKCKYQLNMYNDPDKLYKTTIEKIKLFGSGSFIFELIIMTYYLNYMYPYTM